MSIHVLISCTFSSFSVWNRVQQKKCHRFPGTKRVGPICLTFITYEQGWKTPRHPKKWPLVITSHPFFIGPRYTWGPIYRSESL